MSKLRIIVLQVSSSLAVREIHALEDKLDSESQGRFEVEGHDVGGDGTNVYLVTEELKQALERVFQLLGAGLLPPDVKVAVEDDDAPGGLARLRG